MEITLKTPEQRAQSAAMRERARSLRLRAHEYDEDTVAIIAGKIARAECVPTPKMLAVLDRFERKHPL